MQRSRHSVSTVSSNGSGRLSIWDASSTQNSTPFSTPPSGLVRPSSDDSTGSLLFSRPVVVSFTKGTSLFRIAFARIDVCKDASGGIRKLEMSADAQKRENVFILNFPNSRLPIPHLEQPYSARSSSYRISFLEEQTLQTGGNLFQATPSFSFEQWEDCLRFQETMLGQQITFVGGMAEAKSKGRGEECISQNLRILKPKEGSRAIMIFYANSQRKEKRRYISVPVSSIDHIDPGRRASSSIALKLSADTDLMASLKSLQIRFLEDEDHARFLSVVKR